MANNPLYPGYIPKKKDGGSLNPIYPGYYAGGPMYKRPRQPGLQPMEYDFDNFINEIDGIAKEVANAPLISPKWYADRIANDWKDQLAVTAKSGDYQIDPTDLDDYATDDVAGAVTKLSLNPKDWGVGNKKGIEQTKNQFTKTLKGWVKETTGVNLNNLLESDFSEIQNRTNKDLWLKAMGYGEEVGGRTERLGGRAVADRTTAYFSDVRKDAFVDSSGKKLSPLDLKHKKVTTSTGTVIVEEDTDPNSKYREAANAASDFVMNRDNVRGRDSSHTNFVSKAMNAIREEVDSDLVIRNTRQKAVRDFFDAKVDTLNTIEGIQKIASDTAKDLDKEGIAIKKGWRVTSDRDTAVISAANKALAEIRAKKINVSPGSAKFAELLREGISDKEISSYQKKIERYNARIVEMEETLENIALKKGNIRNNIKRLNNPNPEKNFKSRTTFQDSLGGDLRRDLEKSMLGKKDNDIGKLINENGRDLRARKIAPVIYRLRQDRVHYATKEVLEAFDKGGIAQIAENYAWKKIKDKMSGRLERATSGSIIGDRLKRTNYYGLKIDERGTPTEEYFFKHPIKKAIFDAKFSNRAEVKLDKNLRGDIGNVISNHLKVSGNDFQKVTDEKKNYLNTINLRRTARGLDSLKPASLEIIGDKNIKFFKFDNRNVADQVLLARLLNNDRSEDALEKLSMKMFGVDLDHLSDGQRNNMESFFQKMDYANNWIYQKSGGKIKALDMQRGLLDLGDLKRKNISWAGLKIDKLYISQGTHLDIFATNKLTDFLGSSASESEKIKVLKQLVYAKGFSAIGRGGTVRNPAALKNSISNTLFGKSVGLLNPAELSELNLIINQFYGFGSYISSKKHRLGSYGTQSEFIANAFLEFRKQGITGFSTVSADENDKSLLLIKNVFNKNKKLNDGYKLTDKSHLGRLERINNKMQSLQVKWNKSKLGRMIRFIKNWQEIISEKIVALLSKLLAKIAGITAASLTGPLAVIMPMLQAVLEKVIQKSIEYVSKVIKAVFKLDFDDLDKMLQEDFKKIMQILLLVVSCLSLLVLPIIIFFAVLYTAINPTDWTRNDSEGYGSMGILPTSGEPDPRVFGCGGALCGTGECGVNDYGASCGYGGGHVEGGGIGGFYYSQCDPIWHEEHFPGSEETLCSVGCYATSFAMVYKFFGYDEYDPVAVINNADGMGRYIYGNAFAQSRLMKDITLMDLGDDQEKWKEFFENYVGLIIVNVDGGSCYGDENKEHFVVVSGYSPEHDDFILYDPYKGPDACLKREYPDAIFPRAWGYYQEEGYCALPGVNPELPVDCDYHESPVCSEGATGNNLVDTAVEIACNLRPGFGCLYNYPAETMREKFSHSGNVALSNLRTHLWDQALFEQYGTSISESEWYTLGEEGPLALFWCTWLPTKVYNHVYGQQYGSAYYSDGSFYLGAPSMCKQISDGELGFTKVENNSSGVVNLKPGDIVCFNWGHVGIVYEVVKEGSDYDGIFTIESNSGQIRSWYSWDGSGFETDRIKFFGGIR